MENLATILDLFQKNIANNSKITIMCAFGYRLFCWKLKTENNNKKIISSYCLLLFIGLNTLFMSYK